MDDDLRDEAETPPDDEARIDEARIDETRIDEDRIDEARIDDDEEITADRHEVLLLEHRGGWAAANWGWVLGLGAIAVIFGIVILSHAFGSLSALIWLTGLFLLFIGVAQLLTMGRGGAASGHLGAAVVAIVGGIVLLVWPGETLKVVAVIAGITVLAWGIVRLLSASRSPRDARGHDLIVGIALIVLGALMIVWPSATITLIGILVGLAAVAWGIVMIVGAFNLRKEGRRWREMRAKSRIAH